MANVAALCHELGYRVTGSDEGVYPPMSTLLAKRGVSVRTGYDPQHLLDDAPDLVVVGNALSRGNPAVEAILECKLPYASLPELVKEICIRGRTSVVVAGTHGKTTTAALLAWLLDAAGLAPGFLIGGAPLNFGEGARPGEGAVFVVEGDEYDTAFFDKGPKFLHYLPDVVIIGDIEYDHADIFSSLAEIQTAFRRLLGLVPRNGHIIAGATSAAVEAVLEDAPAPVEWVGEGAGVRWCANDLECGPTGSTFTLSCDGTSVGRFEVPMWGRHNVANAARALVAGHVLGASWEALSAGLARFGGVHRRMELVGEVGGVAVVDDFAHHPTAVRETLTAVRQRFPDRRLWAIFEPRSNTTVQNIFQEDLAGALAGADAVVVAPIHRPHKVPAERRLSIDRLVADLGRAGRPTWCLEGPDPIVAHLSAVAQAGDVVLVMSNGPFGNLPARLLDALCERSAPGHHPNP